MTNTVQVQDTLENLQAQARVRLEAVLQELLDDFTLKIDAVVQSHAGNTDSTEEDIAYPASRSSAEEATLFSGLMASVIKSSASSLASGSRPTSRQMLTSVARGIGRELGASWSSAQSHAGLRFSGFQQAQTMANLLSKVWR